MHPPAPQGPDLSQPSHRGGAAAPSRNTTTSSHRSQLTVCGILIRRLSASSSGNTEEPALLVRPDNRLAQQHTNAWRIMFSIVSDHSQTKQPRQI